MSTSNIAVSVDGVVISLRLPMPEGQTLVADMPPREARDLALSLFAAALKATWNVVRGVL
jgi:hypothetical protein